MTSIGSLLDAKSSQPVIWSVKPSQTVREALELMQEHDIGCVMVREDQRLDGILSERDYARKMILVGKASADTPVSDIMTSEVICARRDNDVNHCLALMNQHGFRHLPVVEDDHIYGMVSIGDLIGSIIKEQQETIEHLQHYIAG
jgi:CBS domain-containing protein